MPRPGRLWRHVVISTLNAWLPGDERGWRSRGHKRHSSGDYRNPPPRDEHAGLRRYAQAISGEAVVLPEEIRPTIGRLFIEFLRERGLEAPAIAVAGMHVHMLVELPEDAAEARRIVGEAKNFVSRKIRKAMPGRVWGAGGCFRIVRDRHHQRNTFHYIRDQQGEGAWVWTYRDPLPSCGNACRHAGGVSM